jgi:DNA-binding transcriptional LysR family regulator
VAFEDDEPSTIRGLVAAGLGLAFISELVLRSTTDIIVNPLKIEEPHSQRIIGLAWRKEHYLSQAAQQFREFVLQYFKRFEGPGKMRSGGR